MNSHVPVVCQMWRSNTDMQPITSVRKLFMYLGKYIGKGEKGSKTLNDLTKEVVQDENLPDSTEARKVLSKAINKVIGQRDVSSQECCHILMG